MNDIIKSAKRQRREAFMTQQDDTVTVTTSTDEATVANKSKPDPIQPWQWVLFIMIVGGGGMLGFILWMDSLLG